MDPDALTSHFRNAMYILVQGAASTDTFRLEVKLTYEYIPTTAFRQWVSTEGPRATNQDQQDLKDIIIESPTSQYFQNAKDVAEGIFNAAQKVGGAILQDQFLRRTLHK